MSKTKVDFHDSDLLKLRNESTVERTVKEIEKKMRTIPDVPEKGVMFHDITTVWNDADAFQTSQHAIHLLAVDDFGVNENFDVVAALEARGWVYGAVLADRVHKRFVPIRKHGRLPGDTTKRSIIKEYGPDAIEMHKDAISKGDRVILVDDLIATGDTILKAIEMIEELGGEVVRVVAVSDLKGLGGKQKILDAGYEVMTAITYPGK